MKFIYDNRWIAILILITLVIIVCVYSWVIEQRKNTKYDPKSIYGNSVIPNELIVSFPENISDVKRRQALSKFIDSLKKYDSTIELKERKTCKCDTIELWRFSDELIIEGHDETAGVKPPTGGQGSGEETIKIENITSLGYNYNLGDYFEPAMLPKSIDATIVYSPTQDVSAYKIAVFDTGLDTTKVGGVEIITDNSCNFENITDDHKHGTAVTQFLIESIKQSSVNRPISILPIKVLDENKRGSLFDLLCGISYAINSGANSMIMSLGYYGLQDTLLEKYLRNASNNNILIFTAAGNKTGSSDIFEPTTINPRNLDLRKYKFYPACFSSTIDNLFTITSLNYSDNEVCDNQNFSPVYVNGAVRTEHQNSTNGNGTQGFNLGTQYLSGSSYANPIFAGKAIKHHIENLNMKRDTILSSLQNTSNHSTAATQTVSPQAQTSQVRSGMIINRN